MKTPDWTSFRAADKTDPTGPCCLLESSFTLAELPRNYIWTLGYLGSWPGPEAAEVSAQVKSYSREWLESRAGQLKTKKAEAAAAQAKLEDLRLQAQKQRLDLTQRMETTMGDQDAIKQRIEAGPLKMARGLIQGAGQLATGGTTDPTERMAICNQCPFKGDNGRCGKCGCFLAAKTRIKKSSCPIGKW